MRQTERLSTGTASAAKVSVERLKVWVPEGFKKRLKAAAKLRLMDMSEFTRDALLVAIEAAERTKTRARATRK
jgi:hypothetical protein